MRVSSRLLALTPVLAFLWACSDQNDGPWPPERSAPITQADKQAALALSLSRGGSGSDSDPYRKAQLCHVAIAALDARLARLELLSPEQWRLVKAAKGIYDDRMKAEALRQGKSSVDLERDLHLASQSAGSGAEKARMAIGCIQDLGTAG